jgi:hypothetical protein
VALAPGSLFVFPIIRHCFEQLAMRHLTVSVIMSIPKKERHWRPVRPARP